MSVPQVYLNIDKGLACKRPNEDVCYEIWVPGGDCVRVVWHKGAWTFVNPFETWVSNDEAPARSKDGVVPIMVHIDPQEFRHSKVQNYTDGPVPLVDQKGPEGWKKTAVLKRYPMKRDEPGTKKINLYTRLTDTPVAFGVNVYSLEYPSRLNHTRRVWSWTSAAVIPWSYLVDKSLFAFKTFMWSDKRMRTDIVKMSELLIVQSDGVFGHESLRRSLESDVALVTREYVTKEFKVLETLTFAPEILSELKNGKEQETVRNSTFNTTLDGLAYSLPDIQFEGEPMPEEFMGSSAQSWYYYDKPVVEEAWLEQKLAQVCWLHQYDATEHYARDVETIIRGKGWETEETSSRTQKLLTDVIRIATMHATSTPYVEDGRDDAETGARMDSDLYCSALKVPGDCEDGAHSAYMIYMSILFGEWRGPLARALQKLAAYLGFPLCITGTAANPLKPQSGGGTHAYGCVVPFPRFFKAIFGTEPTEAAYRKFKSRFKYEYPRDQADALDVAAIETTLFSTPLVGHHSHPSVEREKYLALQKFAMEEMNERHCAAINFMYTFVLDEDCACHLMAVKAFTTAHRELFYSGERSEDVFPLRPRLLDGTPCEDTYSCTFVFWRPGGHVGVHRNELYHHETDCKWELRVPVEMECAVWESDVALIRSARAPFVPLRARVVDPQKGAKDANAVFAAEHIGSFRYDAPHVMAFVYDVAYVYPDGKSVEEKMLELKRVLGAQRHVTSLYDKCLVIVFTDFLTS